MLEASYQPREGRVQAGKATASVARGSRRLHLGDGPGPEGDELLDLSPRGMKIRTAGGAPSQGTLMTVELRHPKLSGTLALQGQVRWVDASENGCTVGIAFMHVRDTTAVALEQVVVSELGSGVHADTGQVGFLASGKEGGPTWIAYDMDRQQLAKISAVDGALQVTAGGEARPCTDLGEVLREVYGDGDLRVVPRIRM